MGGVEFGRAAGGRRDDDLGHGRVFTGILCGELLEWYLMGQLHAVGG